MYILQGASGDHSSLFPKIGINPHVEITCRHSSKEMSLRAKCEGEGVKKFDQWKWPAKDEKSRSSLCSIDNWKRTSDIVNVKTSNCILTTGESDEACSNQTTYGSYPGLKRAGKCMSEHVAMVGGRQSGHVHTKDRHWSSLWRWIWKEVLHARDRGRKELDADREALDRLLWARVELHWLLWQPGRGGGSSELYR